jgi:hypothetical protein
MTHVLTDDEREALYEEMAQAVADARVIAALEFDED